MRELFSIGNYHLVLHARWRWKWREIGYEEMWDGDIGTGTLIERKPALLRWQLGRFRLVVFLPITPWEIAEA